MVFKIRITIAAIFLTRLWFGMYAEFENLFWIEAYYIFLWLTFFSTLMIVKDLILNPPNWSNYLKRIIAKEIEKVAYLFVGLLVCEIIYCIIGKDLSDHPLVVFFQFIFILVLICWIIFSKETQ